MTIFVVVVTAFCGRRVKEEGNMIPLLQLKKEEEEGSCNASGVLNDVEQKIGEPTFSPPPLESRYITCVACSKVVS